MAPQPAARSAGDEADPQRTCGVRVAPEYIVVQPRVVVREGARDGDPARSVGGLGEADEEPPRWRNGIRGLPILGIDFHRSGGVGGAFHQVEAQCDIPADGGVTVICRLGVGREKQQAEHREGQRP